MFKSQTQNQTSTKERTASTMMMKDLFKEVVNSAGRPYSLEECTKGVVENGKVRKMRIGVDVSGWIRSAAQFLLYKKTKHDGQCLSEEQVSICVQKLARLVARKMELLREITKSTLLIVFDGNADALPPEEMSQLIRDAFPKITVKLLQCFRDKKIIFMVAPTSAPAQLAYLEQTQLIDMVLTRDRDLIGYNGIQTACYMKYNRNTVEEVVLLRQSNLGASNSVGGFSLLDFAPNMISVLCILIGCDNHCPMVKGFNNITEARDLVQAAFRTASHSPGSALWHVFEAVAKLGNFEEDLEAKVNYVRRFIMALFRLQHPIIFCPLQKKCFRIGSNQAGNIVGDAELTESSLYREICLQPENFPGYLCKFPPEALQIGIAEGWVNPRSFDAYEGAPAMVGFRAWAEKKRQQKNVKNVKTTASVDIFDSTENGAKREISGKNENRGVAVDPQKSIEGAVEQTRRELKEYRSQQQAADRKPENSSKDRSSDINGAPCQQALQFAKRQIQKYYAKRPEPEMIDMSQNCCHQSEFGTEVDEVCDPLLELPLTNANQTYAPRARVFNSEILIPPKTNAMDNRKRSHADMIQQRQPSPVQYNGSHPRPPQQPVYHNNNSYNAMIPATFNNSKTSSRNEYHQSQTPRPVSNYNEVEVVEVRNQHAVNNKVVQQPIQFERVEHNTNHYGGALLPSTGVVPNAVATNFNVAHSHASHPYPMQRQKDQPTMQHMFRHLQENRTELQGWSQPSHNQTARVFPPNIHQLPSNHRRGGSSWDHQPRVHQSSQVQQLGNHTIYSFHTNVAVPNLNTPVQVEPVPMEAIDWQGSQPSRNNQPAINRWQNLQTTTFGDHNQYQNWNNNSYYHQQDPHLQHWNHSAG